jgi:hypothetical protein
MYVSHLTFLVRKMALNSPVLSIFRFSCANLPLNRTEPKPRLFWKPMNRTDPITGLDIKKEGTGELFSIGWKQRTNQFSCFIEFAEQPHFLNFFTVLRGVMEKFNDSPELCLFEFATPPSTRPERLFCQTIPARPPIRVVIKICYPSARTTWLRGSEPVDCTPLIHTYKHSSLYTVGRKIIRTPPMTFFSLVLPYRNQLRSSYQ